MNLLIPGPIPIVLVVSGSSGSGKGRFIEALKGRDGFKKYVTYTSRKKRDGEVDGVHYHFVTPQDFLRRKDKDFFLEWEMSHGRDGEYYGTPKSPLLESLEIGDRWALEVNVDGFLAIKRHQHESLTEATVSIFLTVPVDTLRRRILERQPNISKDELDARIASIERENSFARHYDYTWEHPDGSTLDLARKAIQFCERRSLARGCYR